MIREKPTLHSKFGVVVVDDLNEATIDDDAEDVLALLLDELRRGSFHPPMLPRSAQEALDLIQGDASMARIAAVIQKDATLAAEVLRTANSPMFSRGKPAAGLKAALARVGTAALRKVIYVCSAGRLLQVHRYPELTRRLQARAPAVAVASEQVALHLDQERDAAFTAGLLHDVGWSVYFGLAAAAHRSMPARIVSDPKRSLDVARYCHQILGAELALTWKLPSPIVGAIGFHHRPGEANEGIRMAYVVSAANAVVDTFGIFPDAEQSVSLEFDEAVRVLRLDAHALQRVVIETERQIR